MITVGIGKSSPLQASAREQEKAPLQQHFISNIYSGYLVTGIDMSLCLCIVYNYVC